jgi:hypothetical protein
LALRQLLSKLILPLVSKTSAFTGWDCFCNELLVENEPKQYQQFYPYSKPHKNDAALQHWVRLPNCLFDFLFDSNLMCVFLSSVLINRLACREASADTDPTLPVIVFEQIGLINRLASRRVPEDSGGSGPERATSGPGSI